jgi:tetratricopeptide (TPR) repeat protein
MLPASEAVAQKQPLEFTRQGLLITNFLARNGASLKHGRQSADEVRERIERLSDKKELDVIGGRDIRWKLEIAGYRVDTLLEPQDLRALGRAMRADEVLQGEVELVKGGGIRLRGALVLLRDERLVQPLPPASGKTMEEAAEQLARSAVAARRQLAPLRRCENALREGQGSRGVAAAKDGIQVYPASTLARTCLIMSMQRAGTTAGEVLSVASEILAVDPRSYYALEAAATALDSLRRREEAADTWLRLAETDTNNLELTERVLWSLTLGGNSGRAEPLAVSASDRNPDHLPLLRQKWRILVDNRNWKSAVGAGEALLAKDIEALADSTFHLRLAGAYRANGQVYKAIETASRGVTAFPGDARLYSLYTQLVRGESEVAIARGLELFPRNAELHAMNAKVLRERGKLEESLASSRRAVSLDSALSQGQLMIAQTELELGRPDSALSAVQHALVAGEDASLVAQFALSKGNAFFRAANGTKRREDFELAMRFLAFADSVRPTTQTKFLLGAAAFSVTTMALTEAPKLAEVDKLKGCELTRRGGAALPVARASLEAGAEVQPDAVKQYVDYLTELAPFVDKQVTAFCPAEPLQ